MRDVVGYEGKYAVDEDGIVWSLNYNRTGKKRALKAALNSHGYLVVCFYKNGKKMKSVHRLVAEAYLPNYSEDLQVDHIDNMRTNNCLGNLRMVTCQQNQFNRPKVKGYSWHKNKNKWMARIDLNGKKHHLGYFNNEDDARQAYLKAKEIYHKI